MSQEIPKSLSMHAYLGQRAIVEMPTQPTILKTTLSLIIIWGPIQTLLLSHNHDPLDFSVFYSIYAPILLLYTI